VGKGETLELHKQQSRLVGKPECWMKKKGRGHRWLKKKRGVRTSGDDGGMGVHEKPRTHLLGF